MLHYDIEHLQDEFGMLSDQRLRAEDAQTALRELDGIWLDEPEYHRLTSTLQPTNR